MSSVIIYRMGPLVCSVCAPKDMLGPDVAANTEQQSPCGTEAGWLVSDDKTFRGGQPMPCPCDKDPARQHWLLEA